MPDQPSNQNRPGDGGVTGAVTAVTEKLSPLCLAAVLLAAIYGYLTYDSLQEERQEFHARQMKLIDMMDSCFGPPSDRRNE